MEEIRFNRPEPQRVVAEENTNSVTKRNRGSILKKILKFLIIILILIILVLGGLFVRQMTDKKDPNTSDYYAVFLANGQVYFGKLAKKNKEEFVIKNVYYLQIGGEASAQKELSESRFSLIKLGDELHGPTDEMFINTNSILFYEKLKNDSKVVESIMSNK